MRFLAGAVVLALIGIPAAAQAQMYCSEPTPPSCLRMKLIEWDNLEFEMCKSQVKRYLDELTNWQACVTDDANDRADRAVKRFNCFASGEDMLCPRL